MRSGLILLLLGLCSTLVFADPNDGRPDNDDSGGGDGDDGASSALSQSITGAATSSAAVQSSSATSTAPSSSTSSSANSTTNPLIGMNGDVVCVGGLMCVGGLVNGTTIQYTLQSLGAATLGWMAMGFGAQMANTPMVIMWPNSDGSITLSQRQASAEVMPTVVANPPRTATLESSLSDLTGSNPKLVFSIPAPSTASNDIIWAFGTSNPGDSAVDASLTQHLNSGPTTLDLTKVLAVGSQDPTSPAFKIEASTGSGTSGSSGTNSGSSSTPPPVAVSLPPLLPYEKYIVAHAICCIIGFLGLLPLGAIVARWARTFSPVWFRIHWVIQFVLALPIIVAGFALGVTARHMNGITVLDTHMQWGIAIFVLYLFQVSLGWIIHFFKIPSLARKGIRGPQNYFHALLGIFIIGISFYQVRTGFRVEWPLYTGRGGVGNGANIVWIIWLVLIPTFYFGGMILLRKQYRQERAAFNQHLQSTESNAAMKQNGAEPVVQ